MSVIATKKLVEGKKIVDVNLRKFADRSESGRLIKITYDPVYTLDNGAKLVFVVDELNSGDAYGIRPLYIPKPRT